MPNEENSPRVPKPSGYPTAAIVLICAVIAALLSGGAVAAYQHNLNVKSQASLESQITSLQQQLAAASPTATPSPAATAAPSPTPTATPKELLSTTPFDVLALKVGDKVGSMTVQSISVFDDTKGPLSNNNATVTFSGQQEVKGTFTNGCDETGGCAPLVAATNLDNVSLSWIPKIDNKTGSKNNDFEMLNLLAVNEFTKGRWNADIAIDNVTLFSSPAGAAGPGNVTTRADLVKVYSKNAY